MSEKMDQVQIEVEDMDFPIPQFYSDWEIFEKRGEIADCEWLNSKVPYATSAGETPLEQQGSKISEEENSDFHRVRAFLTSLTDEQSKIFWANLQNPGFYDIIDDHLLASQYIKMTELDNEMRLMRGQDKKGNCDVFSVDHFDKGSSHSKLDSLQYDSDCDEKLMYILTYRHYQLYLKTKDTAFCQYESVDIPEEKTETEFQKDQEESDLGHVDSDTATDSANGLLLLEEAITRKVEEPENVGKTDCLVAICPLADEQDYTVIPCSEFSIDAMMDGKTFFSMNLHEQLERLYAKLTDRKFKPSWIGDNGKVLIEISADDHNVFYCFDLNELDYVATYPLVADRTTDRNEAQTHDYLRLLGENIDMNFGSFIISGEQQTFKIDLNDADMNLIREYLIGQEGRNVKVLNVRYNATARITSSSACIEVHLSAPNEKSIIDSTHYLLNRLRQKQPQKSQYYNNNRNDFWRVFTKEEKIEFQMKFQVTVDWDPENECILLRKSFSKKNLENAGEEFEANFRLQPAMRQNRRAFTIQFEQLFHVCSTNVIM